MFMLHDEIDGISGFATAKALIDFLGRRYGEGRSFLIVKRAIAEIVGPSLFQFHKCADDIDNINAALYLLYGLLANQVGKNIIF